MNSKRIPSDESSNPAVLSREDLMSELAALRRESRSKDRDVAKAEIKKKLQAMGRA